MGLSFFPPVPFTALLSAVCKASPGSHFAFLHLFFFIATSGCRWDLDPVGMDPEPTNGGSYSTDLVGLQEILCIRFSVECLAGTQGMLSQNCS